MFDDVLRPALTIAVLTACSADRVASQAASASAIVQVASVAPAAAATGFTFTGVPSGTVSVGGTLEAGELSPGSYVSTQADLPPGVALVGITCDDEDSVGDVLGRTATFHLSEGEAVTCLFTLASSPARTSSAGSASGTNPFESPDEDFESFPLPDDLPDGAGTFDTPKAGPWNVTNFEGEMACTGVMSMTRSLGASSESGTLEVLDGGETVVGSGLSDETADVTVHRVPGLTGRYAGSVGGSEGPIPMTIDFTWQLVTDEWIVGYLSSRVSEGGMTCNMFRGFELRWAGG